MKGQLRGSADDLERLVGVGDAGQLDDDPAVPGLLDGRFAYAELIDAPPQHLECSADRVLIHRFIFGVLCLEHDLCPAPQVEAEAYGFCEDEPCRSCEDHY